MATTTISQRDRPRTLVKAYTYTTNQIITGLTFDGHYLWGAGGATLAQLDISSNVAVVKEVTGLTKNIIDLAFDGEKFGVILDKDPTFFSFCLVDKAGNLLIPQQGLWGIGVAPNGIAYDGHYYWVLDSASPSILYQIDVLPSVTIVKQFTLDASYWGLEFDGEFLVTGLASGIVISWSWFDRSGVKVKTSTNEAFAATMQPGIAFDGEFIYTVQSG